ncbi:hypothetical protein [Mesoflavibacter zeaxanthinifaciens]|uniref:hypothetical protein n=1 Tax=Mesoflavibacter zeaxanthinifaciens TaxID=393060 RepID=UPI003A930302
MAKSSLIKISLTDFIDFVSKTGSTKLTQVKKVKERKPYHPSTDYYKYVREGIIGIHEESGDKSEFDNLIKNTPDIRKKENFEKAIKGYTKFLGKKTVSWVEPPFRHWRSGNLDVKLNPEVGLKYDGTKHYIKLYFKSEALSKMKASQILSLMESELRAKVKRDDLFCVLDVRTGKLFCNEKRDTSLLPLLKGEAMSFETIWNSI